MSSLNCVDNSSNIEIVKYFKYLEKYKNVEESELHQQQQQADRAVQLNYINTNPHVFKNEYNDWIHSICGLDPIDYYFSRTWFVWENIKSKYELEWLILATMSSDPNIKSDSKKIFSKLWNKCIRNRHVSKSLSRLPNVLFGIIEGYL
jgi:hypothetical protein